MLHPDGPVVHGLTGQAGHIQRQGGDLPGRADFTRQIDGLAARVVIERRERPVPIDIAAAHVHVRRSGLAAKGNRAGIVAQDIVEGILGGDGHREGLVDKLRRRNGRPDKVIYRPRESVVVDDGADALTVSDVGADRREQVHIEVFIRFYHRVAIHGYIDGLIGIARRKDDRAGGALIVAARQGRAIRGRVVHADFLQAWRREPHMKQRIGGSHVPFDHGYVVNCHVRQHYNVGQARLAVHRKHAA